MVTPHLVLGGPGTGKTTRLLAIVAEEMQRGVLPRDIAFVTFTKVAATEARDRAAALFNITDAEAELPWFRTIHSLAYKQLGIERDEVMMPRDWKEFSDVCGETVGGLTSGADGVPERDSGDSLLRIVDYSATTTQTLQQAWHALDEAVDWWRLLRFSNALAAYKADTGKLDFTDMVVRYGTDGAAVPVRVAIIDEAQDLTSAQWAAVSRAFGGAERVYIGGDDDQAIYHWAGADVARFLALSTSPEILHFSHRLPIQVHAFAQKISARISQRYEKRFAPSPRDGSVTFHQRPDAVALDEGTWFLLARNNYMLKRLEAIVRESGLNYARRGVAAADPAHIATMQIWERLRSGKLPDCSAKEARALLKLLERPAQQMRELTRYTLETLAIPPRLRTAPWHGALTALAPDVRDYYLSCLRRGERLTQAPRIRIETIHGVKGAQCDNVLLMTDLSSRTARSYRLQPDTEHRVFYVGATRCRHNLHIVLPQTDLSYTV